MLYTNAKGVYMCGDRIEIVYKSRDFCILLNAGVLWCIQNMWNSMLWNSGCVHNGSLSSIALYLPICFLRIRERLFANTK